MTESFFTLREIYEQQQDGSAPPSGTIYTIHGKDTGRSNAVDDNEEIVLGTLVGAITMDGPDVYTATFRKTENNVGIDTIAVSGGGYVETTSIQDGDEHENATTGNWTDKFTIAGSGRSGGKGKRTRRKKRTRRNKRTKHYRRNQKKGRTHRRKTK
uniref:Uncharacterized protein n=1 Tax=viral metagenome TaxID=1070528 RepID=A0A6C0B1J1_9ZZZZ